MLNLPMPNDKVRLPQDAPHLSGITRTVIASCYYTNTEAVLLLLNPVPPYYSVVMLDLNTGVYVVGESPATDHENIVPAAEEYNDLGGCW